MSLRALAIAATTFSFSALTIAGCQPHQPAGERGHHEPVRAAPSGDIEVAAIPADVEAFRAWRDQIATDPRGGAAAFVVALLVYSQDPDKGTAYLTVQTDQKFLSKEGGRGPKGYKGMRLAGIDMQRHKERVAAKPYIARSYVLGTSPLNGYALPAGPLVISTRREVDAGPGRVKVWVHSTGADSDRPITLQQNSRGIWKAYEWSSLQVGVRPPQVKTKDDF